MGEAWGVLACEVTAEHTRIKLGDRCEREIETETERERERQKQRKRGQERETETEKI